MTDPADLPCVLADLPGVSADLPGADVDRSNPPTCEPDLLDATAEAELDVPTTVETTVETTLETAVVTAETPGPEPLEPAEPQRLSGDASGSASDPSEPAASEEASSPAPEPLAVPASPDAEAAGARPAPELEVAEPVVAEHLVAEPPAAAEPAIPPPMSPALQAVVEAFQAGRDIEGTIIGWNKGGFHVNLDGVAAFCPKSQIELGNPKRASAYIDRRFPFRILEFKEGGKRIVASRREILEREHQQTLTRLRELRKSGAAIEGPVTSLTDFGAFVDLGGVEGLVHLSQISRRRVDNARDLLQVGQTVQVQVLKIEKGGERISLSMKALEPDPWDGAGERFAMAGRFAGKVARRSDFGLFVELEDGVDGLVHTSQLAVGKTMDDYPDGTAVEGWIREVDEERRRLSLSLREVAATDPWSDLGERFVEGTEIKGTIEQLAKFGVFVILEPGVTGLLPFSAVSLPAEANPRRMFVPGHEISVTIDSIDLRARRISLAPAGAKLEGTKTDYRDYQRRSRKSTGGLNAIEAAFSKLRQG